MVVYNVVASIEIDGSPIKNYFSVSIKQRFNEHHEFSITLPFDVIEKDDNFGLEKVKKLIGKVTIITLDRGEDSNLNEFKGIISNVSIDQVDAYHSQIVLKGFSPTIILENGDNTASFNEKNLNKIASEAMADVSSECRLNINPVFKTQLKYFTQYKESNFAFMNRLSAEFGEWFFYNGKELFFGKPSTSKDIELISGEDVTSIQLKLQLLPASFKAISYQSKDDKTVTAVTPSAIDGIGVYAKHALDESSKLFSQVIKPNNRPRVGNSTELSDFLRTQKSAVSSEMEVISGTSINPEIKLGSVATISVATNRGSSKKEHGKYVITAVTHQISEDGKYENQFEGVPSSVKVMPVKNVTQPIAEPQLAYVVSNNDPANLGRVKVKMLWQESPTDWIRVVTPDGGSGGKTNKNRGYVFIPEVNDQVIVGFRYNDPDRPFVMGSVFHGKNAAGGGKDNKIKTLGTNSGNLITMNDDKGSILMEDAKGNSVLLNGEGKIVIDCSESIELKCGSSTIVLSKDGTIKIDGKMNIQVNAGNSVTIEGKADVGIKALNVSAKANVGISLEGSATAKLSSSGMAEIAGAMVKIN